MKIAMIGSGAAGSVFAAYLRKGGAELWLVDKYKAHMDKIAADGLVFRTPEGEEVLTGFHTSATAHDIGTMDMVILMVKATQTADVMADTMPCIGPETVVVSLQNGLGNDEVLAQFVETDRILYGSGLAGTGAVRPLSARYSAAESVVKPPFFGSVTVGLAAGFGGSAGFISVCSASGAVCPISKRHSPLPGVASAARTAR